MVVLRRTPNRRDAGLGWVLGLRPAIAIAIIGRAKPRAFRISEAIRYGWLESEIDHGKQGEDQDVAHESFPFVVVTHSLYITDRHRMQ